MLVLVFAEASLEFFKGRVLDANEDWKILARCDHKEKRGRPDICHDLLKLSLDSELNKRHLLRVYVHTYDDRVITASSEWRVPRSFKRFAGLMEDLEKKREISAEGKVLLKIEEKNLKQLLAELEGEKIVLEASGERKKLKDFVGMLGGNAIVIIGGFPHGAFLDKSNALEGLQRVALSETELTAPAILAKVLTCAELANGF